MKICLHCGNEMQRSKSDSPIQFERRKYCSPTCASRSRKGSVTLSLLECSSCKEWKPKDGFAIDRRNTSGRNCYCRDCISSKRLEAKIAGKLAAKEAVQYAVRKGIMLSARNYPCASCGNAASLYHHPSYKKADRLNVVPLCKRCHSLLHANSDTSIQSRFGVVALPIGMVRIAIAWAE